MKGRDLPLAGPGARGAQARPLHDELMGAGREAIERAVGKEGVVEEATHLSTRLLVMIVAARRSRSTGTL